MIADTSGQARLSRRVSVQRLYQVALLSLVGRYMERKASTGRVTRPFTIYVGTMARVPKAKISLSKSS
jgi:hypothetical protein